MAQFNVRDLPNITASQIEWLAAHTGMTKTQIVLMAIDRLYQQEKEASQMNTHPVFDTRTVSRDEIAAEIVERVIVHASSAEVLDSYNNDAEAAADGIVSAWTELYPNELPVDQDGDPLDIRRYALGYFERLAEQAGD